MIIFPSVISSMPVGDDKDYMEWLYVQYHRLMFSTAWKYCKKQEGVEDIVSDSCLALMKKISTLRKLDCNKLRIYIVSTVRNTSLNAFQKERRLNERFLHVDDEVLQSMESKETVGSKVELESILQQVISILESLPEKEQLIVRLKYSQGLDDSSIAKKVGLSENSIRKYISRIRDKVKVKMGMEGGKL